MMILQKLNVIYIKIFMMKKNSFQIVQVSWILWSDWWDPNRVGVVVETHLNEATSVCWLLPEAPKM